MTREENALKLRHNHYNFKETNNRSTRTIFILVGISVIFIFLAVFS